MDLLTPLAQLEWLPAPRVRQLERMGLATVGDLLTHFPKRYEDRNQFDQFPRGDEDHAVCVCGIVKKTQLRRIRGSQKMFDVVLEEENPHALSTPLTLRWFNAHWVEKMIVNGHRVVVFGRPKRSGSAVVIAHPEFEVIEDDAEVSIHLQRIVPVHRATEGMSTRVVRRIIWDLLERIEGLEFAAILPAALDATPHAWALRQIHFPENWEARDRARRHLVLAEFFAMQLSIAAKRAEQTAQPGAVHANGDSLLRRLHASLPFPLTGAQQRAIEEIRADLAAPHPMNRLLHGDVGSGKTLVALSAMLLAVEAGFQAALMAPTQILAEQHYLGMQRLCEPLGLRVSLRTGDRREDHEPLPLFANAAAPGAPPPQVGDSERTGAPGSAGLRPVGDDILSSRTSPDSHYSRRRLPHFEKPWAVYAVTISTGGRRILAPAERTVVLDAVRHFHGRRYELFAACVMPDHAHLLLQPWPKESADDGTAVFWSLGELLKSVKTFTAREINRLRGASGAIWEAERFDRYVRSERDLREKFDYIVRNPWDAEIAAADEDYPWVWTQEDEARTAGSPSAQNAPTNGPEARATQARGIAPVGNATSVTAGSERLVSGGTRAACAPRSSASHAPSWADTLPAAEPHILVGTHALLYEGAGFTRLGLAVIDEQHKFGVLQRARLRAQGDAPDVLVMTATPIPRTLTMTLYGDLDVSTLDEMPKNRGRIVTAVRDDSKLEDAAKFLREQLAAGRQAYVVYPLIDESEKLESKAAAAEFGKWEKLLAPMKCELLHGRIPPEEKDAIMDRFRRGETKALIATTVIEVGIDVPNANLMLIENAERFGLAQLHQLRGRIGRGEHKSYCILLRSGKADEAAIEKLATLERTSNGFEIAEADLQMRGPGDILGTAQSGLAPLKLGDLLNDHELMRLARNAAFLVFERDPQLERPEHRAFRAIVANRRRQLLSQVS